MSYLPKRSPLYQLLLSGNRYKLPKGQVIHALNDRSMVSLIETGYIKRYLITKEGNKSIQLIYKPDDIFPMTPIFKSLYEMDLYRGPEVYYYESMTDIVIYSISIDQLNKAASEDPSIYKDLLYASGVRLNSYIHYLEDISLKTSYEKVAHRLIFLADQMGELTPQGTKILLPLTHQDIADILDLSRETVSREMAKLKAKRLVSGTKNIIIPKLDELEKIYR